MSAICPDWEWFRYTSQYGWLCSPKAFRFLERLIWSIGRQRRAIHTHDHPLAGGEEVPGFLRIADTLRDPAADAAWWRALVAAVAPVNEAGSSASAAPAPRSTARARRAW